MEIANRTFKARLQAVQASLGRTSWVDCLSEIALVINTSKCSTLPSHVTPYEVHFGWKPHWIGAPLIGDQDPEEEGDDDSIDGDNSDEEYPPIEPRDIELIEIEA